MKRQDEKRQIVAVCCDGCKDDCLLAVHCLRGKGVCYTLDYEAKLARLIEAAKEARRWASNRPENWAMGLVEQIDAALAPFDNAAKKEGERG